MKQCITFLFLFSVVGSNAAFSDWFTGKALRIDYFHSGTATFEAYSIDEFRQEPNWGGTKTRLTNPLPYGQYFFKAFDLASNTLIFSHGYNTLFYEWQFTAEAKTTSRTFNETVLMPFPKSNIRIEFYSRSKENVIEKKFEYILDVNSYFINTETRAQFPVYTVQKNGSPEKSVDIVLLPEGYTTGEMELFKSDCNKFINGMFEIEPYNQNREKFNISAVLAPSAESGTDVPGEKIWKQTILNCSFYTFDSERYLMTFDNKSVRNLAANVPYDQIYILVNSEKYGGGAIYNFYSTSVNSNRLAGKIFVHELGHGLAGLADEYDDGSTAYNDMYPLTIEPWEPNITTLINFESKWKSMMNPELPIPTPNGKLQRDEVGVVEGAGYVAKGIYRPRPDCLMRTFSGNEFCPVCNKAIGDMINFLTE